MRAGQPPAAGGSDLGQQIDGSFLNFFGHFYSGGVSPEAVLRGEQRDHYGTQINGVQVRTRGSAGLKRSDLAPGTLQLSISLL